MDTQQAELLNHLVEEGDWDGVVLAINKFQAEQDAAEGGDAVIDDQDDEGAAVIEDEDVEGLAYSPQVPQPEITASKSLDNDPEKEIHEMWSQESDF